MADEKLGNDLGEKLGGCLPPVRGLVSPAHSVPWQPCEDQHHVSERRLQGRGRRAWDHHLADRGELGRRHTFLPVPRGTALATLWHSRASRLWEQQGAASEPPFPILDPSWVLKAGGGRWKKRF